MLPRFVSKVGKRGFATYPAYITNAPATSLTKTANGVTVATEAADQETATIKVFVEGGNRYESEKNIGSAKFLEHLAFKGTKQRNEQQLKEEIDSLGGRFSVQTGREHAVYTASVFKGDVSKAFGILSDVVQNSGSDDAVVSRERDAFIAANETVNADYKTVVLDELHQTAFMGTPLGRSLIGAAENTANLTSSHLKSFRDANYTSSRLVVSAAGAVDHNAITELTKTHFGGLPAGNKQKDEENLEKCIFTGSDKKIRYDSMGSAHYALAFQASSWTSEFRFPFMLMQTLLGNWSYDSVKGRNPGAKLAVSLIEQQLDVKDSVYEYNAFNQFYKETGLFGVYVHSKETNVENSMWHILEHMVRLCHEVTEKEVEKAKTQLKTDYLLNIGNGSPTIAHDIGMQVITTGRRMTTAEVFARIDSLTVADIRATANKFINDEDPALSGLGAIFEMPDYNWVRRRTYWSRY